MLLAAVHTVIGGECSVRLDQHCVRNPGHSLQRVDVLRVVALEQSLFVQQPDEVVTVGRLEVARIQLFGQREKRFRFANEVVQFEDGRRIGKFVFAQIVVQASVGRTEVGNTSG